MSITSIIGEQTVTASIMLATMEKMDFSSNCLGDILVQMPAALASCDPRQP